jgi:MFS family permease
MKTFLAKIYSYCFFDDLVFIYPLYAVMFVDYGLTGLQISIILMVWSGTAFLLEVPSGVIADKYSRKTILFLAQVARIIGYAIWLFFPNFWGFLIGFVLWGIKSAFTSGTFEALLYDELKQNGAEVQYTKILGRQKAIKFVALTLAGLGATIGIALGYKLIIAISLISLAISAFSILSLPSAKKLESTHEKDYFKLLKEGLHTAIRTPIILEIIIFVSLAQALFGALDEYWSIFANDVGLPKAGLGIFFIVYGAVQAFASWYAYKFENQSRKFFYSLFLLNGIILFTAAHFYALPSLALLILLSFIFKLIDTAVQGKLQHKIPTSTRATVSSVNGFFVELAVILFNIGFGLVARTNHYQLAFLASSIVISAIGIIYLVLPKVSKSEAF